MIDKPNGADTSAADELRAVFAEAEKTAPVSETVVEPAPSPVTAAEGAAAEGGQPRDPHGRFAPKAGEAEAAPVEGAKPPAATDGAQDPLTAAEKPTEAEIPPAEAPAHWPKEWRDVHEKLPPAAQRLLIDQDRKVNDLVRRKTQELADRGQELTQLDEVLSPRKQALAMNGLSPAQAVQQLFALSDFANQDFPGFVRYLAQQRGIDLASVVQGIAPQQEAPQDQHYQALERQLAETRAQLQTLTGHLTGQQQAAQQQTFNHLMTEVDQFIEARDATGAVLYPHFQAVENDLMDLIPVVRRAMPNAAPQEVLKTAYDRAVWANPQTRAVVQGAETRRLQAEREKVDRERAAAAQRAGVSITGQPTGSPTTPVFADVRDELRYRLENGADRL